MRKDQIENAVNFLIHPEVMDSSADQLITFLEKKGLTKEEIEEAKKRANIKKKENNLLNDNHIMNNDYHWTHILKGITGITGMTILLHFIWKYITFDSTNDKKNQNEFPITLRNDLNNNNNKEIKDSDSELLNNINYECVGDYSSNNNNNKNNKIMNSFQEQTDLLKNLIKIIQQQHETSNILNGKLIKITDTATDSIKTNKIILELKEDIKIIKNQMNQVSLTNSSKNNESKNKSNNLFNDTNKNNEESVINVQESVDKLILDQLETNSAGSSITIEMESETQELKKEQDLNYKRYETMMEKLLFLQKNNQDQLLKNGTNALLMYLKNLEQNSDKARYRKILVTNMSFKQNITPLKGYEEFLKSVGFTKKSDSNEWLWISHIIQEKDTKKSTKTEKIDVENLHYLILIRSAIKAIECLKNNAEEKEIMETSLKLWQEQCRFHIDFNKENIKDNKFDTTDSAHHYPKSFLEISKLVESGEAVSGIKKIDQKLSVDSQELRNKKTNLVIKKPWERTLDDTK